MLGSHGLPVWALDCSMLTSYSSYTRLAGNVTSQGKSIVVVVVVAGLT